MSVKNQIDFLERKIRESKDPNEIAKCKRNLAYIKKGSDTVSGPVAARSYAGGKIDFYAYIVGAVTTNSYPVAGKNTSFVVHRFKNVMAILPFTRVAPGILGAEVSKDLSTIVFHDELGTEMRLHTSTMFSLDFHGKNPIQAKGGWYLLKGVSMPKLNTKKANFKPYRDNGLPWVQLHAEGAEFWESAPTNAMLYDLFSRFHGSVRNNGIFPFPRHLIPDLNEVVALADHYVKKKPTAAAPASSSSSPASTEEGVAAASGTSDTDAEGQPKGGTAENPTVVGSTKPGMEALNDACRKLYDRMARERGPDLFSANIDPHNMADLIFNGKQLIIPIQPSDIDMILDDWQTFVSGVSTFRGPQCITSEEKPKIYEITPENPFGVQAAARFDVAFCRSDDEIQVDIVVSAFLAKALKLFSKIMGIYSNDSVLNLATVPIRHHVHGEIPRVAAFPAVAIGPLDMYRTARANADLPAPAPGTNPTSFLEFTPFDGAGNILEGILTSCIMVDYATLKRLIVGLCITAGIPKASADAPDGVSIAPIVNRFKSELNRYQNLNTNCVIHERTGNTVFSPSQSAILFSNPETEIGTNLYEKINEATAKNFFFFIMSNLVFTDAEQEVDYRAMTHDYFSRPTTDPRKAELLEKLTELSAVHGVEVMKAKDPMDGSSVFSIHNNASFAFELFAVNRQVACPIKRREATCFTDPAFNEESFSEARKIVADYYRKRYGEVVKKVAPEISSTVDDDELAFLQQAEAAAQATSSAPSSSSSTIPSSSKEESQKALRKMKRAREAAEFDVALQDDVSETFVEENTEGEEELVQEEKEVSPVKAKKPRSRTTKK